MFGFGRKHTPSTFNYIPRYYDEDKERFRLKRLSLSQDRDPKTSKPGRSIPGAFTQHRNHTESRIRSVFSSSVRSYNLRLILVCMMLMYIGWVIMTTDYFLQLFSDIKHYLDAR
jgi:hypothetical protein